MCEKTLSLTLVKEGLFFTLRKTLIPPSAHLVKNAIYLLCMFAFARVVFIILCVVIIILHVHSCSRFLLLPEVLTEMDGTALSCITPIEDEQKSKQHSAEMSKVSNTIRPTDSMQNPSLLNLDDINKAIELTRFNVSKNIF